MHRRYESMSARNGDIEDLTHDEDAGIGVRALVGSSVGLLRRTRSRRRVPPARPAPAPRGSPRPVPACPVPAPTWCRLPPRPGPGRRACEIDPLGVPLSDKGDLLVRATDDHARARRRPRRGALPDLGHPKWFVSSEGHRIDQRIRECGAGISATAIGDGETQRRSYPSYRGQYGTRGWELVTGLDLAAHAARVAEEARALLTAPLCPAGETTLILGSEQMACRSTSRWGTRSSWTGSSAGRPRSPARPGWTSAGSASLRYGSELMNITIDPTIPGALGSFGFDDEGTPAASATRSARAIWVGVLAGRDSAARRRPGLRRQRARRRLGPAADGADDERRAWSPARTPLRRSSRPPTTVCIWTPTGPGRSTTSGSTSSSAARSAGRSRTASWGGCCATRRTPASARSSGGRWTCSPARSSPGARPTAARANPGRSATPAIRPRRPGSPTYAWGCARMTRRAATSPDGSSELVRTATGAGSPGRRVRRPRRVLALTRFANSFIHQNVAEATMTVRLRLHARRPHRERVHHAHDGRGPASPWSSARRGGQALPARPGLAGARTARAAAPRRPTGTRPPRRPRPDERADRVLAFVDAAGGLETAGYCRTMYTSAPSPTRPGSRSRGAPLRPPSTRSPGRTALTVWPGSSVGRPRRHRRRGAGRPGGGEGPRRGRPGGAAAGALRGGAGADRRGRRPAELSVYGFNGKAYAERRSFAEPGAAAVRPVDHDGGRTVRRPGRRVGLPFDAEGTPKRRLTLVEPGSPQPSPTTGVRRPRRALSPPGTRFGRRPDRQRDGREPAPGTGGLRWHQRGRGWRRRGARAGDRRRYGRAGGRRRAGPAGHRPLVHPGTRSRRAS